MLSAWNFLSFGPCFSVCRRSFKRAKRTVQRFGTSSANRHLLLVRLLNFAGYSSLEVEKVVCCYSEEKNDFKIFEVCDNQTASNNGKQALPAVVFANSELPARSVWRGRGVGSVSMCFVRDECCLSN